MGNINAPSAKKPLLLGPLLDFAQGLLQAHFADQSDREEVTFTEGIDAFYLPWKNSDYTEGFFDLRPKTTNYFFTADMSGCSLWYRLGDNRLVLRHEARTDTASQQIHRNAGFTLVFDTSAAGDVQLTLSQDNVRTAVYYAIYALVDYEHQQIEFRIQKVRNVKNLVTWAERYELVSLAVKTVLFVYV